MADHIEVKMWLVLTGVYDPAKGLTGVSGALHLSKPATGGVVASPWSRMFCLKLSVPNDFFTIPTVDIDLTNHGPELDTVVAELHDIITDQQEA